MNELNIAETIESLAGLEAGRMFGSDFLLTWDRSEQELQAVFAVAQALQGMREGGIPPRLFESGLAVSLFRDKSTRTRYSFAAACDLLGLAVQDLEEGKSQASHGETVRETAVMVSFLSEVIGIRDDMYLGKGQAFMREVAAALTQAADDGVLASRPMVVNLQCDIDHPTQTLADALHLARHFGGPERLRGRRLAMSWAYSPSYGKPLSVPQGVIGLFTRFGMHVVLAHPEGYGLIPEVEQRAARQAEASGGSFTRTNDMAEAFREADVVYPKSWAPWSAMERRTALYERGDAAGVAILEKELLAQNARHRGWTCTEELMRRTRGGQALYLHCLPADITGVSCEQGEVEASVFERHRAPLYRQAGWKPYIIAAMIYLGKVRDPRARLLQQLARAGEGRGGG
jgi:knotted carbamoyltransferase YgeW